MVVDYFSFEGAVRRQTGFRETLIMFLAPQAVYAVLSDFGGQIVAAPFVVPHMIVTLSNHNRPTIRQIILWLIQLSAICHVKVDDVPDLKSIFSKHPRDFFAILI